jgi:hypothetical protein
LKTNNKNSGEATINLSLKGKIPKQIDLK